MASRPMAGRVRFPSRGSTEIARPVSVDGCVESGLFPEGRTAEFQRESPGIKPGLPYITERKEVRTMFITAVLKIVLRFFGTIEARLRIRRI